MKLPKKIVVDFSRAIMDGHTDKVSMIKAVRVIANLGLKEAKDLVVDTIGDQVIDVNVIAGENYSTGQVETAESRYTDAIRLLKKTGVNFREVYAKSPAIIDRVRSLATVAIKQNELDLAIELIDILKKFG